MPTEELLQQRQRSRSVQSGCTPQEKAKVSLRDLLVPGKRGRLAHNGQWTWAQGQGRTLVTYPRKHTLFSQGERADAVYYIRDGRVKLTVVLAGARREAWRESFSRAALKGDTEELASLVHQAAVESENVDVKNQVVGREATIASLEDTRAILNEMKAKGVPTNWLRGSMENLARRLGQTTNPEYVSLGNRLMGTLTNYRRAATGVQFSARESADYERMFPNYKEPRHGESGIDRRTPARDENLR